MKNNFVFQPESTRIFTAAQKHAVPQSGSAMPPMPSHDDIARRAYDIYVKTGSKKGRCKQNWQQAESELRKQAVAAGPGKLSEAPPAAHAGLEPVVKTIAGALPSIMGGRGATRGGMIPVPQGGRNPKA